MSVPAISVSEYADAGSKEWWTVQELLALKVTGFPATFQGVNKIATRQDWRWQTMPGNGGPRGYHLTSLPEAVRLHIARASARKVVSLPVPRHETKFEAPYINIAALTGRRKLRLEARSLILYALSQFQQQAGVSPSKSIALFVPLYNAGEIEIEDEIRAEVPKISRSTLHLWLTQQHEEGPARLAGKYRRTKFSEVEKSPALQNALLGIFAHKPHLSTRVVYKALKKHLPAGVSMPSLRSVQRYMANWREKNPVATLHLADPDATRSKYRPAFGSYGAQVTRRNQLWELDATPGDAMLVDGRHHVVACIDVASRRARVLVTKTSRASAVAALLRLCMLDWGIPEAIKTDNGADFKAKTIRQAVGALQIEHRLCRPYNPQQKPHIERFIGTLNHTFFELLPGYSGHSVAEAQALRAQRTFANRRGKPDVQLFQAKLNRDELQAAAEHWLSLHYEQDEHAGIGCSPLQMAEKLGPGVRGHVPNLHDLDMLLLDAPQGGVRTVLKQGISVDANWYVSEELALHMGQQLLVRLDPADLGIIHCFEPETARFVCSATDVTLLGTSRKEIAIKAVALHKKLTDVAQALKSSPARLGKKLIEAQRTGAAVDITMPDLSLVRQLLPAPEPTAEELAERDAFIEREAARAQQPVKAQEDDVDRFIRWRALDARVAAGEALSADERHWHKVYQTSSEWRALEALTKTSGTYWMEGRTGS